MPSDIISNPTMRQLEVGRLLSQAAHVLGMAEGQRLKVAMSVSKGKFKVDASVEDDPDRLWRKAFPDMNENVGPSPVLLREARKQVKLVIDPKYGDQDNDTLMVLSHFEVLPGGRVLEVGANDEDVARILTDNGLAVTGVDLRPDNRSQFPLSYARLEGDFVVLASSLRGCFDAAVSTSALEHFGLGTYGTFEKTEDPDYDTKAVAAVRNLLKPDGVFHLTVPYGSRFVNGNRDWRVYDRDALARRILKPFGGWVEEQLFFKSAECSCPDQGGCPPIVAEEDADRYEPGSHPHVTVYLRLRKLS